MDKIEGWKIYNRAFLPTTPPHEEPNINALDDKRKWKNGSVLLARYTTDFDCGYETEWWYCIKDKPFESDQVNAKKRYEIKRGLNNVDVRKIQIRDYTDQLVDITERAWAEYPAKYRPNINREKLFEDFNDDSNRDDLEYWGIILKSSNTFCGYAICVLCDGYVNLMQVKVDPACFKTGANVALVYTIIKEYINTGKYRYICDGERNIRHETKYQDYLTKYFGFRKAYCRLHVKYRPSVWVAIKLLYPFRKLIAKMNHITVMFNVSTLLKMEEIKRKF